MPHKTRAIEHLEALTGNANPPQEEPIVRVCDKLDVAGAIPEERRGAEGPRVKGFHVVREVGRGGMGTVYEAFRTDGEVGHRVAIKLVKRGMDTEFVLRRFDRERRILRALDHKYIARFLDGGATDDGLPFFVMEYVEGLPIDQYVRERTLPTIELLKLFLKVCEAVSYAHRHRIIHRDLKPSNILVTNAGAPKLLDFGVAKLLDLDSDGRTADVTATAMAHRVMTPEYASPSQLLGLPATETDDVYSLGLLLYILLTGDYPYRFRSRAPEEILRCIFEGRVLRPSEAVGYSSASNVTTDPALNSRPGGNEVLRDIKGNLDRVVLKALHKEPERRYASVEEMAQDIRRHLAGQPVLARADSLAFRAARFAGRHRAYTVSTAAVALLCLLLGLILGLSGTTPEAKSAEVLAGSAGSTADVTPELGGSASAEEWSHARRYTKIGEAFQLYSMGRFLFNKRTSEDCRRGIEKFRQAVEKDPSYALAYAGIADCYVLLGVYGGMERQSAFESARDAANRALALDKGLAEAHNSLALVHYLYDWDWEAADHEFRTAIELDPTYVTAHHWRGLLLGGLGAFAEAEAEMQKALNIDPISAPVYADYGKVLYLARRYDEALEKYQRASEINASFGGMEYERELVYEHMGRFDDWATSREMRGKMDPEQLEAYRRQGFKGFLTVEYQRAIKTPGKLENYCLAELFARMGDKDRAFENLEHAMSTRSHAMTDLKVNPLFDPLRSDPRFDDLLRRMKLTPGTLELRKVSKP